MATDQTDTLPVREKEEAPKVEETKVEELNAEDAKAGEKKDSKKDKKDTDDKKNGDADDDDDDDDDKPLDPAKYIEAHILPRLDEDVVDYYLNEIIKKAPKKEVDMKYIRAHPEEFRSPITVDAGDGSFSRVATYTLTSEKDDATFPVRVYHPDPTEHGPGPYPVHLNYHGGGFALGDLQTEAQLCLSMREAGVVVVDVNYRHTPEAVWGKCFEDAWAALIWTRDSAAMLNINPASVSLGGISAGAHIAIVMHHRARDAGIPLRLVMLTVPPAAGCLFYQYYTDSPHKSFHEFVRTPILSWARIQFFARVALDSVPDAESGVVRGDGDDGDDKGDDKETIRQKRFAVLRKLWPHEWMAPLDATSPPARFGGLADVYVRTAELDNLRDEGEAYGMAVVTAGGQASFKRYRGALHTFMYMDFYKQKRAFDMDSVVALRQAHGFAALAREEVEVRVDRVAAAVKAKREQEKAARDAKKKAEKEAEKEAENAEGREDEETEGDKVNVDKVDA